MLSACHTTSGSSTSSMVDVCWLLIERNEMFACLPSIPVSSISVLVGLMVGRPLRMLCNNLRELRGCIVLKSIGTATIVHPRAIV